jgi:fibronectin type 3 domain-containing protein
MHLSKLCCVRGILSFLIVMSLSVLAAEAQIVVTNTNNDGAGSLRQAIIDANSTAEKSIIEFDIPGDGPHRVEPTSRFPQIVNPIVIDGTSQPGWEVGNPVIVIDGSDAPIRIEGFNLVNNAHESEIRGLVIVGYRPGDDGMNGFAIVAETNNNIFEGNFIGIDADGETAIPNSRGIQIMNASNNLIGGTTAEARNVISGNLSIGVAIFGDQERPGPNSFDNKIIGNYFGTNAAGTSAVGNNDNIQVSQGATNTIIGGLVPEERNIISGANFRGIVIASPGTENTQVIGNFIGTDVTGTNAVPNTNRAINLLQGVSNTIIGGTEEGARNIISGNSSYAIAFQFSDASPGTIPVNNNVVVGNYIGVDVTGTTALPNNDGILFSGLSENNVIGGDTPAERNIISGNTRFGIQFTGINSKENLVIGNYIGTDPDGSSPIPNGTGIFFFTGANNNTIGGSAPGEGNLISGNSQGIVFNEASDNIVIGNFIGTDSEGTGALSNSFGISISNGSTNNIIGGADPVLKNIISGNSSVGINISQATTQGNQILGNHIGIDISGMESLPNGSNGIQLSGVSNTIHGNVISANSGTGVSVLIGGDDNIITGNYIGTNANGNAAMPNGATGIWIRGNGNTVGGVTSADRNIVSGNNQGGIRLFNFGTQVSDNVITGNFIGLAANGTTPLANNGSGIFIDTGSNNIIGGEESGAGNVISGNNQHGIQILNAASSGNRIEGNLIGTDFTGQSAVGNNNNGITLTGSNTVIKNNTISGNSLSSPTAGIDIFGNTEAINNVVTGNRIGTNLDGDQLISNNGSGILVRSPNNVIGGLEPDDYNIISGNTLDGIFIIIQGFQTFDNQIFGNYIGTNPDGAETLGNGRHGIFISGSSGNFVGNASNEGSNTIAFNQGDGVRVQNFSTTVPVSNSILSNSIFSNQGLGIDLGGNGITENDADDSDTGPNNLQNFPEVSSATIDNATNSLTITYMVPSAPSNSDYPIRVEFFATNQDERQGKVFLGTDEFAADDFSNGGKEITLTITGEIELEAGSQITGTATDDDGNTSEFGALVTVEEPLSLPAVVSLISPEDESVDVSNTPTFTWSEAGGADTYTIQLSTSGDFSSTVIDESGITETEFEAEALDWETTYFWRVRASNEAGDGEWSEVWSFTTEQEPLSAPDAVVLVSPEDESVDVSISPTLIWEAAATAESYRVQVSLSGDFSDPLIDQSLGNVTEYSIEDLDYETQYTWRVRASNEAGDGEWSEVWSFTTEQEPLSAPDAVVLVSPEDESVDVSISPTLIWEAAATAESYRVQVSLSGDFADPLVDQALGNVTEYALTELSYETTYFWRVRASNEAGDGEWSEVWSFTTEQEPLSAPDAVVLVSPEDESVDVSISPTLIWEAAATAESYRVQASLSGDFSDPLIDQSLGNVTEYSIEDLDYETQYTWRVRASNEAGDGEWSEVWSFTTEQEPLSAPDAVVLVSPEDESVDVSISPTLIWEAAGTAESYRVQVSLSGDFADPLVDQALGNVTEYALTELSYETTYFWRVRASNEAGDGEWSEVWSFTTEQEPLSAPDAVVLVSPEDESVDVSISPTLIWEAAATAESYRVQASLSGDFSDPLIDQSLGNVTEYSIEDLDYETQYTWRVRASNEAGDGEWSEVWSFTTEQEPLESPATPELVSPANQEYNVPLNTVLTWEEAARADFYRLQVSEETDFSSLLVDESDLVETSFNLDGLDHQTTYVWRVRAFNDAGESEWSAVWLFGTESEVITVTNVQTIDPSGGTFFDEETGIEVEFPEGAVSEPTEIISGTYSQFPPGVIISGALTFLGTEKFESINFSLPVHVTVDYDPGNIPPGAAERNMRVLRYTELTETWEELESEVNTETKRVQASTTRFSVFGVGIIEGTIYEPGEVTLLTPEDGSSDVSINPHFTWQEVQNTDTYTIEIATDDQFSDIVINQSELDETSYQATGLELNNTYYWRVRGVNEAGPGDWSEVWSFTTGELSPPGALTLSVTDNTPELSWEPSSSTSVSGYNVYRGAGPAALELLTELDASASGYTDSDVPQGGSFYAITATGPGGSESAFTNAVSFFRVDLEAGNQWQLVSHAVSGAEADVSGSLVYGYNRVYGSEQSLLEGSGYWIKDDAGAVYVLSGEGTTSLDLTLNAGWNLVGGPAGAIAVDDIDDPSAILTTAPVYGYSGGMYTEAEQLIPGSGYWLYAETGGQVGLTVDLTPAEASSGKLFAASVTESGNELQSDRLVVNSSERKGILAIYGDRLTRDEKLRYLRPPIAPGALLDVRTSEGFGVMDTESAELLLTVSEYPVVLSLETAQGTASQSYHLVGVDENGAERQWPLVAGAEVVLTQPFESLSLLRATAGEEMISETRLEPGYPNPFNPATNIRYRLARQGEVLLEVYDLGGRRIATLVNQNQPPGAYTVGFDGAGLASGIYFVRLQAGTYTSIQKLTLIK